MRPLTRHPFAFSLRTLLALVTLVCAWLAWERHVVLERRAFLAGMNSTAVITASRFAEKRNAPCSFEKNAVSNSATVEVARVTWIRRLLGDEPIQVLFLSGDSTHSKRAAHLFSEAEVVGPSANR